MVSDTKVGLVTGVRRNREQSFSLASHWPFSLASHWHLTAHCGPTSLFHCGAHLWCPLGIHSAASVFRSAYTSPEIFLLARPFSLGLLGPHHNTITVVATLQSALAYSCPRGVPVAIVQAQSYSASADQSQLYGTGGKCVPHRAQS